MDKKHTKKLLLLLALLLFSILPKTIYAQVGPPMFYETPGTPINELKTEFKPMFPDPLGYHLFPNLLARPPVVSPSMSGLKVPPRVAVFDTITMVEKVIGGRKVWAVWEPKGGSSVLVGESGYHGPFMSPGDGSEKHRFDIGKLPVLRYERNQQTIKLATDFIIEHILSLSGTDTEAMQIGLILNIMYNPGFFLPNYTDFSLILLGQCYWIFSYKKMWVNNAETGRYDVMTKKGHLPSYWRVDLPYSYPENAYVIILQEHLTRPIVRISLSKRLVVTLLGLNFLLEKSDVSLIYFTAVLYHELSHVSRLEGYKSMTLEKLMKLSKKKQIAFRKKQFEGEKIAFNQAIKFLGRLKKQIQEISQGGKYKHIPFPFEKGKYNYIKSRFAGENIDRLVRKIEEIMAEITSRKNKLLKKIQSRINYLKNN